MYSHYNVGNHYYCHRSGDGPGPQSGRHLRGSVSSPGFVLPDNDARLFFYTMTCYAVVVQCSARSTTDRLCGVLGPDTRRSDAFIVGEDVTDVIGGKNLENRGVKRYLLEYDEQIKNNKIINIYILYIFSLKNTVY